MVPCRTIYQERMAVCYGVQRICKSPMITKTLIKWVMAFTRQLDLKKDAIPTVRIPEKTFTEQVRDGEIPEPRTTRCWFCSRNQLSQLIPQKLSVVRKRTNCRERALVLFITSRPVATQGNIDTINCFLDVEHSTTSHSAQSESCCPHYCAVVTTSSGGQNATSMTFVLLYYGGNVYFSLLWYSPRLHMFSWRAVYMNLIWCFLHRIAKL